MTHCKIVFCSLLSKTHKNESNMKDPLIRAQKRGRISCSTAMPQPVEKPGRIGRLRRLDAAEPGQDRFAGRLANAPVSDEPGAGAGRDDRVLGATLAGKTSLMRIMAGLDRPTEGRVLADGVDVTGVPVRQRNVAMVYQQFINYPSMTVFDNIASPLKLRGESSIADKVMAMAARLHIDHLVQRYPSELSGGQQQRVALARALVRTRR